MAELSPSAQAVLDAAIDADGEESMHPPYEAIAAATLRAAADLVVPEGDYKSGEVMLVAMNIRLKLLAIADELQGC